VSSLYRGHRHTNEAAPIVAEEMKRRRLADKGFTSTLDRIQAWKGEAFVLISAKIDELQEKDRKAKARKVQK